MSIDVRTYRPEDARACHEVRMQSLAARAVPFDPDRVYMPDNRRLVAADGDRVVGTLGVWELGQWWGGRCVAMGGVGGVAVSPTHRGRGVAHALVREALRAMRERGEWLSVLYGATQTLYRAHGYELAGLHPVMRVPARDLLALPRPQGLEITPLTEEDVPATVALVDEIDAGEPGGLRRSPAFAERALGFTADEHGFAVRRDGELVGFVWYEHRENEHEGSWFDLAVHNLAARDGEAERALWWLLGTSASVSGEVEYVAPPNDPLRLWLPERSLRLAGRPNWFWMLRLVDVAEAISGRGFPEDRRATIHLEITGDEDLAANRGRFVLEVEAGRGRLTSGGDGAVRLDVGALAALYTGWASARMLAHAGRLDAEDPQDLRVLTDLFAGPTPWLRDFF